MASDSDRGTCTALTTGYTGTMYISSTWYLIPGVHICLRSASRIAFDAGVTREKTAKLRVEGEKANLTPMDLTPRQDVYRCHTCVILCLLEVVYVLVKIKLCQNICLYGNL